MRWLTLWRLTLWCVASTLWCLALRRALLTLVALALWCLALLWLLALAALLSALLRCITAIGQFDIVNAPSHLDAIATIVFAVGFDMHIRQVEDVLRAFGQHGAQSFSALAKEGALDPLGRAVAVLAFFAVVKGQRDIGNSSAVI